MQIWWMIAACGGAPDAPGAEPVVGGDAEVADAAPVVPIGELLQQAAEKGAVGDAPAAIDAWRRAYAGWEVAHESRVRQACDRCATEIEYDFGRLRAEIARPGGKPLPILAALRGRLAKWLPPAE
jgi:hypothetical protein